MAAASSTLTKLFVNINDYDFQPKHSQESIDKAVEWFQENKKHFSNTTNFCIVLDACKSPVSLISEPCHARLGTPRGGKKEVVGTEIAFDRPGYKSPGREPFLKWFLYDSFASRFILNKDDYAFCKDYGIIVSCDIPAPLLQNIAIVSRHFRECVDETFDMFLRLLEKGYPGHLCYLLSMNGLSQPDRPMYSNTGHRAFGIPHNMATLNNHLKGDIIPLRDTDPSGLARVFSTIYGGNAYGVQGSPCAGLFPHDLLDNDEDLRKELSVYRGESTIEAYKPPNPFAANNLRPANPRIVIIKELEDVILPYMQSKGLFNVSA